MFENHLRYLLDILTMYLRKKPINFKTVNTVHKRIKFVFFLNSVFIFYGNSDKGLKTHDLT